MSDKEQTARQAVACRGFATQNDEILAERYGHFTIEASIIVHIKRSRIKNDVKGALGGLS